MQRSTCAAQSFARRYIHGPPEQVRMSRFENDRLDYRALVDRLARAKRLLGRSDNLTLTEKIMYGHIDLGSSQQFRPDRLAFQGITAADPLRRRLRMAGSDAIRRAGVPTTVHCESYDPALEAVCSASGIGLWRPGSGETHQVLFENYAFPGGLIVGTDPRTSNAGGMGMLGIAVDPTEAAEILEGLPWGVETPPVINVRLSGKLSGWASPRDIVLKVADMLQGQDAKGAVLEYSGPGSDTLSCTDMAIVCNMGAELGATSSLFPFTQQTHSFLSATDRRDIAQAAQAMASTYLRADKDAWYDGGVMEIDLDTVEPHISGPFRPDLSTPMKAFKAKVMDEAWPEVPSGVLIESGSYLDISRAAEIARQAAEKGLKVKVPFMVSPGSEQVRAALDQDGSMGIFEAVTGPSCCRLGEPDSRQDHDKTWNSKLASSWQQQRQGDNTHVFVGSPEIVMAIAFAGKLTFNPMRDRLVGADGVPFTFEPPLNVNAGPRGGYCSGSTDAHYQAPGNGHRRAIDRRSRLSQTLPPSDGDDHDKPVLGPAGENCGRDRSQNHVALPLTGIRTGSQKVQ